MLRLLKYRVHFGRVEFLSIASPKGGETSKYFIQPREAMTQLLGCLTLRVADDDKVEEETCLSRADHKNRNMFNELPNGKIKPSAEDDTVWKDADGREWKLNAKRNAAYHQPMPVWVAFVWAHVANVLGGFCKVPNLKFISTNADGRYLEICANRYTGELVIDQTIMGTFNLATDAPDAMKGCHERWQTSDYRRT